MTALTRAEIAAALDDAGAEWDTVYTHYKLGDDYLVVEIALAGGGR